MSSSGSQFGNVGCLWKMKLLPSKSRLCGIFRYFRSRRLYNMDQSGMRKLKHPYCALESIVIPEVLRAPTTRIDSTKGADRMNQVSIWFAASCCIAFFGWFFQPYAVAQQPAPQNGGQNSLIAMGDESPLLVEPKTPATLFNAVVLMFDLARPNLAKKYLEQLMALEPDDAAILRIRDKHGPAVFLKLARKTQLQPLSIRLLQRMNQVFRRAATSEQRIDQLIADLNGTVQQRDVAILQLQSAGPIVVPRLLAHMSDPKQVDQRNLLLYTLIRLGRQMIPPLLAAMDVPDANLRATVIEALGWMGTSDEAPHLWHPAFGPDQPASVRISARHALARILFGSVDKVELVSAYGATRELERIARQHFIGGYQWPLQDDGSVAYWLWDTQTEVLTRTNLSPEAASLLVGTRLARQAISLLPENRNLQALYLGLSLATAVHKVGWDRPLPTGPNTAHNLALTAGEEVMSEVLSQAIDAANPASAVSALQVLGQIGTRHQLYVKDRKGSPIIAALNYPNLRVQFAAACTILQLDPDRPFRGSSRVVDILRHALSDGGAARGLAIDADSDRASNVAAILENLGYEPDFATTGQDGFRIAAARGDVELILLHTNSVRWGLSQTIVNLRADARTANIPIAIYGPDSLRHEMLGLAERFPLTTFIVESTSAHDVRMQLQPFMTKFKTPPLTPQQRSERIDAAAFWFAHIANGKRSNIFNLAPAEKALFHAINDPKLASRCLFALGAVPSNSSQEQLMQLAVMDTLDTDTRETAILQLAFHIQRFGLLLSSTRIHELEQAADNASETALRTAWLSVIGSLKPNAKRVNQRLLKFPQPSVP